jgi:hypothetical protein
MTHRSWVDQQGRLVSQPTLTVEDWRRSWTKRTAGPGRWHATPGIGLQRALDGGCDSIEHGLEMTDAQIEQMPAGDVVLPDTYALLRRLGAGRYAGR